MHSAVYNIEVPVGRGTPRVQWPVVDVGKVGDGVSWHILDPNTPICNTRGVVKLKREGIDANAIRFDGYPVCAKCRTSLGPVTLPKG